MHTIFTLALSRPQLLAQHLRGYADLASIEAQTWTSQARTRLMVSVCMLVLGTVALILAGIAAMLWPVYAGEGIDRHTALLPLLASPLLPLIGAVVAGLWLWRHPAQAAFPHLREQLELDLASLQDDDDGAR